MTDRPSDQEHIEAVERRRRKRMELIDAMHPDMRALVHDYGFHIVNSFVLNGITKPRQIRGLVETVLDEFSPTRGTSSAQGKRATNQSATP